MDMSGSVHQVFTQSLSILSCNIATLLVYFQDFSNQIKANISIFDPMTSLNVQRGDEVEITIQNLLDNRKQGHNHFSELQPCISMVPRMYRDQNPSCFDPDVISIGPLHRKNENVQEYEGLKATYLNDLLARLDSPPKQILEACFSKVLGSIKEIKECYAGVMKYDNLELANMMVTDACFILEFLQKYSEAKGLPSGDQFVMSSIFTDLVLLENQIPFFVLHDIFNCTLLNFSQSVSLITLLRKALHLIKPFKDALQIDNLSSSRCYYKHIVDILHKDYQPPASTCFISSEGFQMHLTVELDLAGVHFKPNLDGNWPLAMKYETSSGLLCFSRPTLRLPVVKVEDSTEIELRNLIAYEQSSPYNGYYFTSYAYAMHMLVDSTEDVVKLVESKVILNYIGSNESAANLFNGLGKMVTIRNFSYKSQWKQLDDYYNRYWPKNIARLKRTYFNSPWNMIALVAVTLLFALTVIQTWFTIKPSS